MTTAMRRTVSVLYHSSIASCTRYGALLEKLDVMCNVRWC